MEATTDVLRAQYYLYKEADIAIEREEKSNCSYCLDSLIKQESITDRVLDFFYKKEPIILYGHRHGGREQHENVQSLLTHGVHLLCLIEGRNHNRRERRALNCPSCRIEMNDFLPAYRQTVEERAALNQRKNLKEKINQNVKFVNKQLLVISLAVGSVGLGAGVSMLAAIKHEMILGQEVRFHLAVTGLGLAAGAGAVGSSSFDDSNIQRAIAKIALILGVSSLGISSFFAMHSVAYVAIYDTSLDQLDKEQTPIQALASIMAVGAAFFSAYATGMIIYSAAKEGSNLSANQALTAKRSYKTMAASGALLLAHVATAASITKEAPATPLGKFTVLTTTVVLAAEVAYTTASKIKSLASWGFGLTAKNIGAGLSVAGIAGTVAAIGNTTIGQVVAGTFVTAVLSNLVCDLF